MKKLSIIILTFFLLLETSGLVHAATPSSSPTPSDAQELKAIQRIQDMVASKVAQLNLVEKLGFLGTVTNVTNTQIKINDIHGNEQIVDIDELTAFNGASSTNFGISDIHKGDLISFVGLYNKDTQHLLARFVRQSPVIPVTFDGVIAAKDSTNYNFTMYNDRGEKKIIDIEDSTTTILYTASDNSTIRSGFSKTFPGVRAIVTGFPDKQNSSHIIADRILVLDGVPLSQTMQKYIPSPTPSTSATPSTTK